MHRKWTYRGTELTTDRLDTPGAKPIKRAVKEAFHGPRRKLDRTISDGDSSAWQTLRRAEPGKESWPWKWSQLSGGALAGTSSTISSRLASPEAESEITHTLPHSCWGASRGWQGGPLLKSCCCLEMAFMWMGALIGVVWRLLLHTEHRVILVCWVFN